MKSALRLLAALLLATASLPAQTPPTPVAAAPAAPIVLKGEMKITSTQGLNFDSATRTAVFTGDVVVTHPTFNLTSDKLVVYLSSTQDTMDHAVATGAVTLRQQRLRPDGTSELSVGKSREAIFRNLEQTVELTNWPQIQQASKLHIATEQKTVMILDKDGKLTTRGGSRTVLPESLQPTPETAPAPKPAPSAPAPAPVPPR